ncbi:MAG: 2-hydroxyacid dehydrogenase [Ktedonobacterales bacterium]
MEQPIVVVTTNASAEQKAQVLEILGNLASLTFLRELPPPERSHSLQRAQVLLSWNFPREVPKEDYSSLKPGTLIQLISAGADHMPFGELPPTVIIASNPGAYALPMAEHVMAMTLALAKRLLVENQKLQHGEFDQFTPNRLLSGMTAGILGFGGIGRATARLMRAFGLRIYAINHSGASSEPTDFLGALDDLERVLRESDVVVVSLPLNRATRGLIGSEQLAWMKPDAILVNVARAAIIDEEALYQHARSHPNFRLGIDAWWTEPFLQRQFRMEYPFLELANVLGSPHNSGVVPHIAEDAGRQAAENVKRFLKGELLAGVVHPEDYL